MLHCSRSPLHVDGKTLEKLLEYGCPPDERSQYYDPIYRDYNQTPLARAAENGHYGIVEKLLCHGANPNLGKAVHVRDNPLKLAISRGHLQIVQCLLDSGARMCCDGNVCGCGSLSSVEAVPFPSIFQLLLDRDANPRVATIENEYPLARALKSGSIPVVQMLLDGGVRLRTPDLKYGRPV